MAPSLTFGPMSPPLDYLALTFRAQLDEHIRIGRSKPFELDKLDCSIWVADWVLIRTRVDLAADFRGQYKTRDDYLRLLIPLGGLVRVAARRLAAIGAETIPPVDAQDGDIGIVPTTDGPALAIRDSGVWLTKTGDDLAETPDASFAWRLP